MLSRHISRPISQKFLDSNDTRSFKRKARESPKLQSKSSKYQKFYKNDSRIHTAHENGMLTTEDEKIQYPKNSVTQPNTILFKLNQEEVMQNMAEGPGETFYARGPDSISSIENLMDSDSSSHSSPIRSWSHCTTISSTSRSNSAIDDAYDHPLERIQDDFETCDLTRDYTYESNCTEPLPSNFYFESNVESHTADGKETVRDTTVENEISTRSRRENFSSEAISSTQDNLPPSVPSPSRESCQAPSSISDEDSDPSVDGGNDNSSQSQTSSKVSDVAIQETSSNTELNTLESVINGVLRTEPLVAEFLCRSLSGKLECAPSAPDIGLDSNSSLSMLRLLTIQDRSPVQHLGAFTYAPSSSSSSSSASNPAGTKNSLSSSAFNGNKAFGSSNTSSRGDVPNDKSVGQSVKQQKGKSKLNTAPSSKIQSLRCFHNVSFPETFCVSHATRERFRACGGPGWNTFQHLKEHMSSHHRKKPDSLKCSGCQKDFKDSNSLKEHNKTEDCEICCLYCEETFEKKTARTAHQNEKHPDGADTSLFKEIDDETWKRLNDNLKTFTESLRKGKGPVDPNRITWIEKNTERYMDGRPSNANPILELGQWYIVFKALSLQEHIPEHPFYDYMPAVDLAEERIRLIFRQIWAARIRIYGPPPSELQAQGAWYEDILGQSLQIASKLRLKMNGKPQINERADEPLLNQSYQTEMSSGYNQQALYNPQINTSHSDILGKSEMMMSGDTAIAHRPQLPMMNQGISMASTSQVFVDHQQPVGRITGLSNIESATPNSMISRDWDGAHHIQQSAEQLGIYGLQREYSDSFEFFDSNMLDSSPHWSNQQYQEP